MKDIGWQWSSCGENISWTSNSEFCLKCLHTWHKPACCWLFLIIIVMYSGYWCPAYNIELAFRPRSTNHEEILSNVALIRAQMGNVWLIVVLHAPTTIEKARLEPPLSHLPLSQRPKEKCYETHLELVLWEMYHDIFLWEMSHQLVQLACNN